ncbi:MAG: hypothetical protein KDE31_33185 [Caldilineaceae bacterium]|nr:hypothetical protein [Caldilineaceae bacterium]
MTIMGLQIQQTVFEVLEPGEYPARVVGVESAEGVYGPQLRWTFDLGDGHKLTAWTSQTFSAKSKLGKWTAAAFSDWTIPRGYVLDTDDLLNRPLRLIVVVEAGRDGPYNKVAEVLPPRRAQQAPATNGAATVAPPLPLSDDEVVPF